jgi:hypothetical protein
MTMRGQPSLRSCLRSTPSSRYGSGMTESEWQLIASCRGSYDDEGAAIFALVFTFYTFIKVRFWNDRE